jgi:cytochrome c
MKVYDLGINGYVLINKHAMIRRKMFMKSKKLILVISLILTFAAGMAHSGDVGKGKSLFNDSNLGTNGKSCNSCHAGGMNIDGSKETFSILGSEQESVENAVNFCIEMALNGKPLGQDSEKMNDMVSYLKTLKVKKKTESETPGY